MSRKKKMVIITSNEDIIREVFLTNPPNTRIIDLDDAAEEGSIEADDENLVNLALLAELPEFNSSREQVYKCALDVPLPNPSQPAKERRESTSMICAICGNDAIGYCYNVPACASCKAFFRRNANQSDQIRCLNDEDRCSVAHKTRRKCAKCRLKRCFAAGMRKDFLLSEEEKQRRKKRLEEKRNASSQRLPVPESTGSSSMQRSLSNRESLPQTTDEMDHLLMNISEKNGDILFDEDADLNQMGETLLERLSVEDWITIENIRSTFLSVFVNVYDGRFFRGAVDRTSALINWSYVAHEHGLRFINFCRQIVEFERLNADDRLILVKYHLFTMFPIVIGFHHKTMNLPRSNEDKEKEAEEDRFLDLCFNSNGLRDRFMTMMLLLVQLTEQDPVILSLLLTILILYPGFSRNEDEAPLKEPFAINQAQCSYTRVLWNYMKDKWGEAETCRRFSQLLVVIFRIQSFSKTYHDYFRAQFTTSDAADKLAPLMQSVLNLS